MLVHDYLVGRGGAERVLESLCKAFPGAPVYSALYDRKGAPEFVRDLEVHTSFLQSALPSYSTFKYLLPMFPIAFESLKLPQGATVISSASGFAKCVSNPGVHICYCYTPPRFLWDVGTSSLPSAQGERLARALFGAYLRGRDLAGAAGVDRFVAISHEVRRRIRAVYGREADVIEPPVDLKRFDKPRIAGTNYIIISRLLRYKRVDVAIEACNRLGRSLTVIGDGPDRRRLEGIAGPTVRFTGYVSDQDVSRAIATARAVIVTAEEDWGMAAIEAAAAGCPTIAAAAGGNNETVVEGVTGLHYAYPYGPDELARAVVRFETSFTVVEARLREHASRFEEDEFIRRIKAFVSNEVSRVQGERSLSAKG